MQLFLEALLFSPFLVTTLLAGVAASVVSGIVGTYVVVKRVAFISGSISHAVLGGIGFCLWLERARGISIVSPLQGALAVAILSALCIGWIHLRCKEREDSAIAVLWSVGMAIGMLFISQTPGFNVDLANYLFGNILWVSQQDLILLGTMDGLVLLVALWLHKRFLAICFDEDQARLQGQPVDFLYVLLLLLIAISVVLLIQVVGILLVITMLTIPPSIANLATRRLSSMMAVAVLLGSCFCLFGTSVAFFLDWPAGATIALVAGVGYAAAHALKDIPHGIQNMLRAKRSRKKEPCQA